MSENNSQTQNQISALRTLQQSYDALADASASGATATALESAKQAILTAIDAIDDQIGDVESVLEYIEQGGMPQIAQIAKQGSNSNANISDIQAKIGTPAQGQPSDLFAAIAAGGGGSAAVPQISVPDSGSAATQELAANTLYIFPNRTNDLTITLGTPVAGEASEYHFIVEVGSTLPTITLPAGLTWKSSDIIAFDINTTYEVSILDNYAIFVVW